MPNLVDIVEVAESLESSAVHVAADRCVAVRNRHSTCRKCVDACLTDAITVKNNKLDVSAGACVACGACTTVCPTEALVPIDPLDAELAADIAQAVANCDGMAVFACARMEARHVGDPDKFAAVPCLARMEESVLLALVARGVHDLVLVDGTCKTCKYRACVGGIDATVASANTLLAAQGSSVRVRRVSEFPEAALSRDAGKTYGAARRGFFTQAGGAAKSAAKTVAEKTFTKVLGESEKKKQTIRDRLRMSDKGSLPQFAAERRMRVLDSMDVLGRSVVSEIETRLFGNVEIDLEKCSSCLMCTVFCPTGAIKKSEEEPEDGKGNLIEFSVADCVQCNLCADACLKKCLTVSPVISTEELFDFEPRIIHLPEPPARPGLLGNKKR